MFGSFRRYFSTDLAIDLADDVVAQPQVGVADRGQRRVERLDAARVDRAHLLDDAKEAVELLEHQRLLVCAELEPCELGDATHVVRGKGHREISDARRAAIKAKRAARGSKSRNASVIIPR
jgi:hypothetical protein